MKEVHGLLAVRVAPDPQQASHAVRWRAPESLHGTDGYGMGLAHAARVLGRHAGNMRAGSTSGDGALLALVVPAPIAAQALQRSAVTSLRRPRMLLMEGGRVALPSLAKMVERAGRRVDSAAGRMVGVGAFERALLAKPPRLPHLRVAPARGRGA